LGGSAGFEIGVSTSLRGSGTAGEAEEGLWGSDTAREELRPATAEAGRFGSKTGELLEKLGAPGEWGESEEVKESPKALGEAEKPRFFCSAGSGVFWRPEENGVVGIVVRPSLAAVFGWYFGWVSAKCLKTWERYVMTLDLSGTSRSSMSSTSSSCGIPIDSPRSKASLRFLAISVGLRAQ